VSGCYICCFAAFQPFLVALDIIVLYLTIFTACDWLNVSLLPMAERTSMLLLINAACASSFCTNISKHTSVSIPFITLYSQPILWTCCSNGTREILQTGIKRYVHGRKSRRRPKKRWPDGIKEDVESLYVMIQKATQTAQDRATWRRIQMSANSLPFAHDGNGRPHFWCICDICSTVCNINDINNNSIRKIALSNYFN